MTRRLRVGVYSRWLRVLGGGERYACAFAQALSDDHDVVMLTNDPVSRSALERALEVDLSRVGLEHLGDDPEHRRLARRSRDLDLFINASHAEVPPAKARRNMLVVHFPIEPAGLHDARTFARWPRPRRLQHRAWLVDGWGEIRVRDGRASRAIDPLARVRVELPNSPPPAALIMRARLASNSEGAHRIVLALDGAPLGKQWTVATSAPEDFRLELPLLPSGRIVADLTFDVKRIAGHRWDSAPGVVVERLALDNGIAAWATSPNAIESEVVVDRFARRLAMYQAVVCNSAFTRGWIERRWGCGARVLYPPVAVVERSPRARSPIIVSVGRFFPDQHNKRHLEMVEAFKKLTAGQRAPWSLHLVGQVADAAAHREYVNQVSSTAAGASVVVHANASGRELRELYDRASMYWHSAGFGVDATIEPERLEHFGIAVVEAMARGCVPLVYGEGGPAEIVEHGASGLHWQTLDDLCAMSQSVMTSETMRAELAAHARMRALQFGERGFGSALRSIVADLFDPPSGPSLDDPSDRGGR